MKPRRTLQPCDVVLRRAHVACLAFVLVALAGVLGRAPALAASPSAQAAPAAGPPMDQIIVLFASGGDVTAATIPGDGRQMDRLSAAAGLTLRYAGPMSGGAHVLQLPVAMSEAAVAVMSARIAALPDVVYAEPNAIMQVIAAPALPNRPVSATLTPDDARFGEQWHYRYEPGVEEGLNLLPAWAITTGSSETVVAVIDTGILPHADLAGRSLPGYDFIADPGRANDGDGIDSDPSDPGDWTTQHECFLGSDPQDSTWHGTHVAGTIGAASNNGSDVAGVNWNAMILPVRVLGRCGGTVVDIANGIRWAAGLPVPGAPPNPNPADVINLSLGGAGACPQTYQLAFDDLAAAGVVAVVAAGNSSADAGNFRPANCNHVITVAATNRDGDRAYYSNYGSTVEISAPGGELSFWNDPNGVLSTLNDGFTSPGNDDLVFYHGTSMAAPHVAGLVSLLLGEQPGLSPMAVTDILLSTARAFPDGSNCTVAACGAGIADALSALNALDNGSLAAPTLLAPANGESVPVVEVAFAWTPVAGAAGYRLQVAADEAFDDLIVNDDSLTEPAATALLPGEGPYWWRARALGDENGPWSETWQFTVALPVCNTPGVPALLWPGDGETVGDLTPAFVWDAAVDATGYEIRIGLEPDVSDELVVGLPSATEFTPDAPLLAGETYYWHVRGRNMGPGCDTLGEWSTVHSVTMNETALPEYRVYLPPVLGQ